MIVDTRKLFKPVAPKKTTVREEYAKKLAVDWLIARTTAEREEVRQVVRAIKMRDNIAYIVAMATARIAATDLDKARWFADFLRTQF